MMDKPQIAYTWQGNGILRDVIIDVEIGVPGGQGRDYKALIDTGATNSCITKKVADDLGLVQSGLTDNHTAGGIVEKSKTYVVDAIIKGGIIKFEKWAVVEVQLTAGKYDMLIGMDIIANGDFAITHKGGKTKVTFCVPSMRDFDFVPEANNHNRLLEFRSKRTPQNTATKKKRD